MLLLCLSKQKVNHSRFDIIDILARSRGSWPRYEIRALAQDSFRFLVGFNETRIRLSDLPQGRARGGSDLKNILISKSQTWFKKDIFNIYIGIGSRDFIQYEDGQGSTFWFCDERSNSQDKNILVESQKI